MTSRVIRFKRLVLFCRRDVHVWAGVTAESDGHSLTCAISAATVLVGFEYVWRRQQRWSWGWEWLRT